MKKVLISMMIVLSFTGLSLAADFGTLSCFPPSGTGYGIGWVENGGTFTTTATTLYVAESSGYLPTCVGYRDPNGVSNYQLSADIQFGTANEYGFIARGTIDLPNGIANGYYCAFNADSGYFNIVKIVNGLANPPVKDTDFFNLVDEETGYTLDPNDPNLKIVFTAYNVGSSVVLDGQLYDSSGNLIKAIGAIDDGTVGGAALTGDDYGTYCGKSGDDPINAYYSNMAIVPVTNKITGTVTLQDWSAATSGVVVDVQVQNQADDSIVEYTKTLDPNGIFSVPILANGDYLVRVKGSHWLSDIPGTYPNYTVTTINSVDGTASFSLFNGDVNGDNINEDADLALINMDWLNEPPILDGTDLNGDGVVEDADLQILNNRWLYEGEEFP